MFPLRGRSLASSRAVFQPACCISLRRSSPARPSPFPLTRPQIRSFSSDIFGVSSHAGAPPSTRSDPSERSSSDSATSCVTYSRDQVAFWRQVYFGRRIQHSSGVLKYSDSELLQWRTVFELFANEFESIHIAPVDYVSRQFLRKHWREVFGNNFIRTPSGEAAFDKSPNKGFSSSDSTAVDSHQDDEDHERPSDTTNVFEEEVQIDDRALTLGGFAQMVAMRYADIVESRDVSALVERFRREHGITSDFLHFGEFCKIWFLLDSERLRQHLLKRAGGSDDFLASYFDSDPSLDSDAVITEEGLFRLMEDFNFTVKTSTDMRRLLRLMDFDQDMMVSQADLRNWIRDCQVFERPSSSDGH